MFFDTRYFLSKFHFFVSLLISNYQSTFFKMKTTITNTREYLRVEKP